MVTTRDLPWLLVIGSSTFIALTFYLLLKYVFAELGFLLFSGQGYFVRTKLFNTIAEAQPPEFADFVFAFGPVSIWLAIFGGVLSVQGYRLGLQMTIITLVISGLLSLAYHDEVSPLSVGMGGFWPSGQEQYKEWGAYMNDYPSWASENDVPPQNVGDCAKGAVSMRFHSVLRLRVPMEDRDERLFTDWRRCKFTEDADVAICGYYTEDTG